MSGKPLRWVGLASVIAAVVLSVVLASRFGTDPALVDSPLIGKSAPEFELMTLQEDATFSLQEQKGEIIVVNFFASWCLQCRAEHADLVAASDAFGDDGVTFVQISYQESPQDSIDYLAKAGSSEWTHYLQDPGSRTAIAFGVFGIPETFFIDENGIVVGKIIGETNALMLGSTIDAIKRGEKPGQSVTGSTQQQPEG
ncbi:MAG: TlpA disulfide reductase family protein [Actinomycetota bacterium]|nr:TlpA disulfide reductase family protein [Actinomycetota bacterium]